MSLKICMAGFLKGLTFYGSLCLSINIDLLHSVVDIGLLVGASSSLVRLNKPQAELLIGSVDSERDVFLITGELVAKADLVCLPSQGLRIIYKVLE